MGIDDQDLISIILPAYNHEKYVAETITSIINQTYQNIELIIINDGSSDNTDKEIKKLLPKCKKRFSNTIYINRKNEGLIKTLNQALNLSNGTYISPTASDDRYRPDAMEALHRFLSNNNDYSLVVGDNSFIDDDGNEFYIGYDKKPIYDIKKAMYKTFGEQLQKWKPKIDFHNDSYGSYKSLLLYGNHITNGFLIRRKEFEEVGFYTNKAPLEDYGLMLQLAKISKFRYIDKVLYDYRKHVTNASSNGENMWKMTRDTLLLEQDYAYANGYKKVYDRGALGIKRFGIPGIVEIIRIKKFKKNEKHLKILGLNIMSYRKKSKK